MLLLLVEPYPHLARALVRGLQEEGIATHWVRDEVEADVRLRSFPYAGLLVNWNVPANGGHALVRRWRRNGLTTPVLMFVPSAAPADRLLGLTAGADEVLPLPFSFSELLQRLRGWLSASAPIS
jgi:DNA-binding response OmpR family regulator